MTSTSCPGTNERSLSEIPCSACTWSTRQHAQECTFDTYHKLRLLLPFHARAFGSIHHPKNHTETAAGEICCVSFDTYGVPLQHLIANSKVNNLRGELHASAGRSCFQGSAKPQSKKQGHSGGPLLEQSYNSTTFCQTTSSSTYVAHTTQIHTRRLTQQSYSPPFLLSHSAVSGNLEEQTQYRHNQLMPLC